MISISGRTPRRHRTARNETAAADGNDQCVKVRCGLQHFQRQRALTGDDVGVVERVHEHVFMFRGEIARVLGGLGEGAAVQHHLGAVPLSIAHLHEWRVGRHHDGRRNAEAASVIGDALRVVARTHGNHAPCFVFRSQRQQLVQSTTFLEAGRELQVLELEPDFAIKDAGQSLGVKTGRALDRTSDFVAGSLHVGECDW